MRRLDKILEGCQDGGKAPRQFGVVQLFCQDRFGFEIGCQRNRDARRIYAGGLQVYPALTIRPAGCAQRDAPVRFFPGKLRDPFHAAVF